MIIEQESEQKGFFIQKYTEEHIQMSNINGKTVQRIHKITIDFLNNSLMRFLPSPEGIFMKLDWTKEGVNINSKQLTSL